MASLHAPSPSTRPPSRTINLIVVGDVHNHWDDLLDRAALHHLAPSAVIFVGDLGNQDVPLVRQIASLGSSFNLVTILGNHDAWYCLTDRGRKRAIKNALQSSNLAMFSGSSLGDASTYTSNQIREMLEVLGDAHVGYARRTFDSLDCVFVGARPFSKGGVQWSAVKAFYETYYHVGSMEESAERVLDVILAEDGSEDPENGHSGHAQISPNAPLVVVAHNGPSGLGSSKYSPCGVDFMEPEDDFGDPDLEEALETAWMSCGKKAALVTFGHMHARLKHGGSRNMVGVDGRTGTVYLNAAVVPRVERVSESSGGGTRRHFVRVGLVDGVVVRAENVWVRVGERGHGSADAGIGMSMDADVEIEIEVEEVECILEKVATSGRDRDRYRVYQAYTGEWIEVDVDGDGG